MNKPILDKSMAITRGALPGSNKLLVGGVPFREVKLSGGEAPVRLYDTSGPYTDDNAVIDIEKGLPARRRDWILARGDVEEYEGRARKPEDDGLKNGEKLSVQQFDRSGIKLLRAKPGRNVTPEAVANSEGAEETAARQLQTDRLIIGIGIPTNHRSAAVHEVRHDFSHIAN